MEDKKNEVIAKDPVKEEKPEQYVFVENYPIGVLIRTYQSGRRNFAVAQFGYGENDIRVIKVPIGKCVIYDSVEELLKKHKITYLPRIPLKVYNRIKKETAVFNTIVSDNDHDHILEVLAVTGWDSGDQRNAEGMPLSIFVGKWDANQKFVLYSYYLMENVSGGDIDINKNIDVVDVDFEDEHPVIVEADINPEISDEHFKEEE